MKVRKYLSELAITVLWIAFSVGFLILALRHPLHRTIETDSDMLFFLSLSSLLCGVIVLFLVVEKMLGRQT